MPRGYSNSLHSVAVDDEGKLRTKEFSALELVDTNVLIAEVLSRFNGGLFVAYSPARCAGEYPDQVYYGTDLEGLPAIGGLLESARKHIKTDLMPEAKGPNDWKKSK